MAEIRGEGIKGNDAEFGNPWERMSDQEHSEGSAELCTCHLSNDEKGQENVVGQMLLREREACTGASASAPDVVVRLPPTEIAEDTEKCVLPVDKIICPPQFSPLIYEELPDTHIGVAWLVTLCFNIPLGVLAICMSMKAAKLFVEGKRKEGNRYSRLSLYASLAGIVLTVVIVMSVILYLAVKETADRRKRLRG